MSNITKFILFTCFMIYCIVSYGLIENFTNEGTRNYTIDLLSKDKGEIVFKNLKNVKNYNDREMNIRSKFSLKGDMDKKEEMKITYINNVMEFNNNENEAITGAIDNLFKKYKNKVPLITKWKIIKLNSNMDWGYPHTIGDYIILSSNMSNNMEELSRTLFHEQLHIIQRKEPEIFKKMYKDVWNFEDYKLPNNEWINKYIVHNPDSDDYYSYKLNNNLYIVPLPTTYNNSFTEEAIFLDKNKKIIENGEEPYIVPLKQLVDYNTRFYNSQALYHPNEIFATLLTDIIFNNLNVNNSDKKAFDNIFKKLEYYM